MYLTSDQTRYIYMKVKKDSSVIVGIMKQEMEEDRLDKKNGSEEENPYQTMIINYFEKINVNIHTSQMEQCSTLSNIINYVQYNRNPLGLL